MAAPKVNIENAINEILLDLDFGVERAECLSKFVEKWQVSTRTETVELIAFECGYTIETNFKLIKL